MADQNEQTDELIGAPQAALILGMSRQWVRMLTRLGELEVAPNVSAGRTQLYSRQYIEAEAKRRAGQRNAAPVDSQSEPATA